ncbi:MAG: alpha/beta hydrolase [Gemmatimonadetes bacterium]|nr:lysophospholipase [Gemmatimonadota bacterium]NNM06993.1 alpha/beta hydrolase [Gemmatimonadota bacterium]
MTGLYREGQAPGAQGIDLSWRLWEAPAPRSALLLVHGLGEHSGRYDAFASTLASEGNSVFSFDLRGHGRSPGARGDVDAFPRLLEDLLGMEAEMARQVPGHLPRYLMGHSLGGLICIRRLQVFKGPFEGAIISAPWMATALPDWLRKVGRFLGVALPTVPLPAGINPGRLTRDPDMVRAWREDPLIHTRVTGRFFREAEREQRRAWISPMPKDLPLLFLIPGDDQVVRSSVTETFARGIAGAGTQVELLEGRRHEPLNDLGRDEVYEMVIDWLAAQTGADPD